MGLTERHWFENEEPELTERQLEDIVYENKKNGGGTIMIQIGMEKITPAKAVEYLKANKNNYRKLSRAKVNLYAKDMADGNWQVNGETVVFAKDGTLKDGQHRLAAIAQSGKTIELAVVRNVDNAVTVFDVGTNRTLRHIVSASDVDANTYTIAAANIIVGAFKPASKGTVLGYIGEHVGELNRAYRASCVGWKTRKASAISAAYLVLRSGAMPFYEVELFFKVFNSGSQVGADGYETSSALVAKKQFDEHFKRACGQLAQREQLDILCQALTDFHKGKERTQAYKVSQPFAYEAYLEKVRKVDGLS